MFTLLSKIKEVQRWKNAAYRKKSTLQRTEHRTFIEKLKLKSNMGNIINLIET